jgi:hypothetical protein
MKLQAAIKYAEDDMKACMVILQKKLILTLSTNLCGII